MVADTMVAGVHFPHALAPDDVGYRALAVNLSDIAAMGANPRWMTLMLTLPAADQSWLQSFATGLFAAAGQFNVALIGGDTTSGAELVISIQLTGEVAIDGATLRNGARSGDAIYVTGTPGDAAAGLSLMQGNDKDDGDAAHYLRRRFARPEPRVATGKRIAGLASAAIDLSDGLYSDLEKLVNASDVGATLELDAIPRSPALLGMYSPETALNFALAGGDDYELCFTATEGHLPAELFTSEVPVTRIGRVQDGAGLRCTLNGKPFTYRHEGYRHFQ